MPVEYAIVFAGPKFGFEIITGLNGFGAQVGQVKSAIATVPIYLSHKTSSIRNRVLSLKFETNQILQFSQFIHHSIFPSVFYNRYFQNKNPFVRLHFTPSVV